jgi:hypothetical protein
LPLGMHGDISPGNFWERDGKILIEMSTNHPHKSEMKWRRLWLDLYRQIANKPPCEFGHLEGAPLFPSLHGQK